MTMTTYLTVPIPKDCRVGFGSQVQSKARVLTNTFGNGYTQRAGDGINNVDRKYSVSLANLTIVESKALDDFFVGLGGYRQFLYQRPGLGYPEHWVCEEWGITHTDAMIDSMTCTWTKVFT